MQLGSASRTEMSKMIQASIDKITNTFDLTTPIEEKIKLTLTT